MMYGYPFGHPHQAPSRCEASLLNPQPKGHLVEDHHPRGAFISSVSSCSISAANDIIVVNDIIYIIILPEWSKLEIGF